jgi:hypothetical protein
MRSSSPVQSSHLSNRDILDSSTLEAPSINKRLSRPSNAVDGQAVLHRPLRLVPGPILPSPAAPWLARTATRQLLGRYLVIHLLVIHRSFIVFDIDILVSFQNRFS